MGFIPLFPVTLLTSVCHCHGAEQVQELGLAHFSLPAVSTVLVAKRFYNEWLKARNAVCKGTSGWPSSSGSDKLSGHREATSLLRSSASSPTHGGCILKSKQPARVLPLWEASLCELEDVKSLI